MVLSLAKNSKAGCRFRPNFQKQVVIEIRQKFQSTPGDLVLVSLSVKTTCHTLPAHPTPLLISRLKANFTLCRAQNTTVSVSEP